MMDIRKLSEDFEVRILTAEDVDMVFAVYQGNPDYFRHMNDVPERSGVLEDMSALPKGKTAEDKKFLGFFGEKGLTAVMDLILGYPDEVTAFIGLFMMERSLQGRGIGSTIIREAERFLKKEGYQSIRLAYIWGNPESEGFWYKNGFHPTGTEIDAESYTMIVMEKQL